MKSKFFIASGLLCLVVGIKSQPACGPEAVKVVVVSRETKDAKFLVDKLLTQDAKEIQTFPAAPNVYTADEKRTNYWTDKLKFGGSFVLDLGCVQTFQGVKMINTHKNMATKQFK